jgi:hypothetical protein
MSVYSTLNFDFDTTKFGSALYLSPQAEAFLNAAPLEISTWQTNDLANGNVQMTNYYKNPAANVCADLTSNANIVLAWSPFGDIANTFPFAATGATNLVNNLNSLLVAIPPFKSHTDNVSGVVSVNAHTDVVPTLNMVMSIGNQLLRIVNATDGVTNTTPMLGSMTSLYIVDDLVANNVSLQNDFIRLNSLYDISNANCIISATEMDAIVSRVESTKNYMNTRRAADWAFYAQSVTIMNDYQKLSEFDSMGNTHTTLVNTLIGTDRLKNNLANS